EFLKATGLAAATAAGWGQNAAQGEPAQAAAKSFTVRRVESDRFVLDFSPSEPRTLRILQLTDTHFGNDDAESRRADQRSFEEIRALVARHRPDFLVHTGDFINNDRGPQISFEAIEVFDD